MSEWNERILDNLCFKITDGAHHSPSEFATGIPMFSVKDMKDRGFDYSKPKKISLEDYEKLIKSGCQPKIDDILIAKDGSVMKHVFRVKQTPDYVLLSSIAILRPNKAIIDPTFLVYSIKTPDITETILNNYVSGSGVPRIVLKDFKKVEIKFPPLPEQHAIASVLSSLDDKIDLLHRQNTTLESMAETLFRQWFVEEAKEDWEEKLITDLFEVRDGTHDSPKQKEFGKRLITSKHLSPNEIDFNSAYYISEEDYENVNKRSKVDKDDILFSMIGTIGIIYLEQSDRIDYAIKNIGLFKTSQNTIWKYFTFLWLKSEYGKEFIHEHRSGSTQEYIPLGSLRSIVFMFPNEANIIKFNLIVQAYFQKIKTNQIQIRTLTALRDTLLPKLMSGEVRVNINEMNE
jgi:type I restriction enzyme S subunit